MYTELVVRIKCNMYLHIKALPSSGVLFRGFASLFSHCVKRGWGWSTCKKLVKVGQSTTDGNIRMKNHLHTYQS